jgi:hypothetical protein
MRYQRFAPLLLLVVCALPVNAQSGRRQVKAPPAAPVPTPTPEATPTPKKEAKKSELLFFIGTDRSSSYSTTLPFSYYDAVLRGCASRLRAGTSADVEISDHDVNRGEAIKKAKSETKAYVVWLNLTLDTMARSYDDLVLEFIVYAPETAKIVTNGRSYLTGRRAGPIVVDPTAGKTTSGLYREELLKRAGEDAGDRIIKALHLDAQIQH